MNNKIYFNNSFMLLTSEKKKNISEDKTALECLNGEFAGLEPFIHTFLNNKKSKPFRLICSDVENAIKELKKHFIYIEAAGGLIEQEKKFLFIFRRGSWDLPKGKLEKGESPEKGAIRECEEECGISNTSIIKPLLPSYHIYPYKKGWALKKTHWYLMKSAYMGPLIPQVEEDITEANWFEKETVMTKILPLTYPSVQDVVNQVLPG